MATKGDLLEAQNFSRRRLLTAFVSGAPGGKELEPTKPLRAVIIGVVLAIAVLLGGLFYGMMRSGLPDGWENGHIIIDSQSGARYVSIDGTLYPVLNIASARLLVPDVGATKPLKTDTDGLKTAKIGPPIGIPGAPDALPEPKNLVNTGWTACVAGSGTDTRLLSTPIAKPVDGAGTTGTEDGWRATVVRSADGLWIISGSHRFPVTGASADAVIREAGLASVKPRTVSDAWLNLFTPGSPIAPISIRNAGDPLPGTSLRIGEVVHTAGADGVRRVVLADGTLSDLPPLAYRLYQLGGTDLAKQDTEVMAADLAGLENSSTPLQPADWPRDTFTAVPDDASACAMLTRTEAGSPVTVLATTTAADIELKAGTSVEPGRGSLVYMAGRGDGSAKLLTLVDSTGTAYAIPGADDALVARLGYAEPLTDVAVVDSSWMAFFQGGPELTVEAARVTEDSSATP